MTKPLPDSYFAGHFDGEGCVALRKGCIKTKGGRSRRQLHVAVRIAHRPILELYQRRFGGSIYGPYGPSPSHSIKRYKPMWQWSLFALGDCERFLQAIAPYTQEKHEQVKVSLEWIEYRKKLPHYVRASPSLDATAELVAETLSKLKKAV